MIEVAFSDSARGSLVLAQSLGKGKYRGGCVGVILDPSGREPTREEIDEAQRRAEERHRLAWERAVPLGGRAGDVFGFSLGLSVGDISEDLPGEGRLDVFRTLCCCPDQEEQLAEQLTQVDKDLTKLRERIGNGEPVRIWYSENPDELCGFYWLMDQLRELPEGHGALQAVKIPEWLEIDGSVREYNGCGDIAPGEFWRFLEYARPVSEGLRRVLGNKWRALQDENAPLRAVLNGRLMSVREDVYDSYIRTEIGRQPREFREARVIGDVLGRYQLGIGDGSFTVALT